MKKILGFAGAIALSIIPTPSFSGEVEQKEMMSVTEQLLPQIGEKYKNLDIKEKKAYKEALINYLEDVQKTEATGVGAFFRCHCLPAVCCWVQPVSDQCRRACNNVKCDSKGNCRRYDRDNVDNRGIWIRDKEN